MRSFLLGPFLLGPFLLGSGLRSFPGCKRGSQKKMYRGSTFSSQGRTSLPVGVPARPQGTPHSFLETLTMALRDAASRGLTLAAGRNLALPGAS